MCTSVVRIRTVESFRSQPESLLERELPRCRKLCLKCLLVTLKLLEKIELVLFNVSGKGIQHQPLEEKRGDTKGRHCSSQAENKTSKRLM